MILEGGDIFLTQSISEFGRLASVANLFTISPVAGVMSRCDCREASPVSAGSNVDLTHEQHLHRLHWSSADQRAAQYHSELVLFC